VVLDVVDLPDPTPDGGEQVYEVGTAGINYGDTHHRPSPCSAAGGAGRPPGR
jgi:NADPH:quinone reductase-like Zn-dependent oxidoreductase